MSVAVAPRGRSDVADLIEWLDDRGCEPTPVREGQWSAHCPMHDDAEKSLSIGTRDDDGRPLINCHASCDFGLILNAYRSERGERVARRFASRAAGHDADRAHDLLTQDSRAWARVAEPPGFTREAAVSLGVGVKGDALTIPERDARADVCNVLSWVPRHLRGEVAAKGVLAGQPRGMVFDSRALSDAVYVVEGGACTVAMSSMGLASVVGLPSATIFRASWCGVFAGRRVYLLPDCDGEGREGFARSARMIARASGTEVYLCELDGRRDDGHDVADLLREFGPRIAAWKVETRVRESAGRIDRPRRGRPPRERATAVDFIRFELTGGPVEVSALRERAESAGISWRTVERAKGEAGARSTRKGGIPRWELNVPGTKTTPISFPTRTHSGFVAE